jgi:hypothetical protein
LIVQTWHELHDVNDKHHKQTIVNLNILYFGNIPLFTPTVKHQTLTEEADYDGNPISTYLFLPFIFSQLDLVVIFVFDLVGLAPRRGIDRKTRYILKSVH